MLRASVPVFRMCLALGVVTGVRAIPRAAKRAPGEVQQTACLDVKRLVGFLGVGNNLQVIWFLEFLVNQFRGNPLPPND